MISSVVFSIQVSTETEWSVHNYFCSLFVWLTKLAFCSHHYKFFLSLNRNFLCIHHKKIWSPACKRFTTHKSFQLGLFISPAVSNEQLRHSEKCDIFEVCLYDYEFCQSLNINFICIHLTDIPMQTFY